VSVREAPPADAGTAARVPRADLAAAGAALGLLVLACVAGAGLYLAGRPVHASSAPFTAHWFPHVGPGTPLALAVAALVGWHGPRLAARLSWRPLLAAGYAAAIAWILSLALIDGWQRGLAGRLTTSDEYLSEVGGVTDVPAMLRGFTGRILAFQPDSWTTHVAGHPPGALLVFVGLDRVGLGGGTWAALVCVAVGALIAVAIPVTIRALGDETAARAAVPFLVLLPGAVWIGVSADGMFAGVTATGLALLAVAATRRHAAAGFGAGLLLAFGLYLSYGLTLIAVPALAVLLLARRRRPLPWLAIGAACGGGAAVVAAFTFAGFSWLDGYHLVVVRYYQGIASERPYAYWIWADLALVIASAGPAAAVLLRRAALDTNLPALLRRPRQLANSGPAALPPFAAPARRPRPVADSGPFAALQRLPRQLADSGPFAALQRLPRLLANSGPFAALQRQERLLADSRPAAPLPFATSRRYPRLLAGLGPASLLPLAALAAILAADLSGLSKAEVERIWLPFAVWLTAGATLLPAPSRRFWLIVQASVALLVNHLLLTTW